MKSVVCSSVGRATEPFGSKVESLVSVHDTLCAILYDM